MMDLLAPRDPREKRKGFYVLLDQRIGGLPQNDGAGRHPIYLDGDRLTALAGLSGGIREEGILSLLTTAEGFKRLVHSVGVSAVSDDPSLTVGFSLIFYGPDGPQGGGCVRRAVPADGGEQLIVLGEEDLPDTDRVPGQFLFELPTDADVAAVTVKLYVNDGYDVPETDPDGPVDTESEAYRAMIARSFLSGGNNSRVKRFFEKVRAGKPACVAFLGGSITQGAGAVPTQEMCYAKKAFDALCRLTGAGEGQVTYIKAGVGGTPSQLGLIRYDRDIGRDGTAAPDLVVLEFAVNDGSDETQGVCYESLVRRILAQPNAPALVLLFSVFVNDWNLKSRLAPIGWRYELPMVDVLEAVSPQFGLPRGEGLVITKRQYFYDVYHPANLGHQVMADSLTYLFERLDRQQPMEERPGEVPVLYGADWQEVRLLDRRDALPGARIDPGSFTLRDTDLQSVPLDEDRFNTPQFPHNWQKGPGSAPFVLELECSGLQLVFKDSGDPRFGTALVRWDGGEGRLLDARKAGWTHCHATVLFREEAVRPHRVEISMAEGFEDRTFTILGFGVTR